MHPAGQFGTGYANRAEPRPRGAIDKGEDDAARRCARSSAERRDTRTAPGQPGFPTGCAGSRNDCRRYGAASTHTCRRCTAARGRALRRRAASRRRLWSPARRSAARGMGAAGRWSAARGVGASASARFPWTSLGSAPARRRLRRTGLGLGLGRMGLGWLGLGLGRLRLGRPGVGLGRLGLGLARMVGSARRSGALTGRGAFESARIRRAQRRRAEWTEWNARTRILVLLPRPRGLLPDRRRLPGRLGAGRAAAAELAMKARP